MRGPTVKISGPGETMAGEIYVIKKALEEAGYPVTINDQYPCEDPEHIDRVLAIEDKVTVHIKVEHLPWGG